MNAPGHRIGGEDPLPRLTPRDPASHKGSYGRVLVIGGSRGMSGAAALAAMAALRSGAGLVEAAVPAGCLEVVASFEPSYLTAPLEEDAQGRIALSAATTLLRRAAQATAVALGPGLGRSDELTALVGQLYADLTAPLVVDADALNALADLAPTPLDKPDPAGGPAAQPKAADRLGGWPTPRGPRILTPHPGEFARLVGRSTREVQAQREAWAQALAARRGVVVVLKGHRSVVSDGEASFINATGNPGMATGGTGDVLTGIVAALAAGGLGALAAARLGAHVHGLAGDLAAAELGETSLVASDLVKYLPRAFRALEAAPPATAGG